VIASPSIHQGSRLDRSRVRSNDPEACWPWTAYIDPGGYGRLSWNGRSDYAHHIAWCVASGLPIPPGMHVLHTCDVRHCSRNDEPGIYVIRGIARPRFGHLFLGTHRDNMADRDAKGRARTCALRGEASPNARLTREVVLAMRAARADGRTVASIAREYGVNPITAQSAICGTNWRHLPNAAEASGQPLKLSLAQATEAASRLTHGESLRAVARRFDVHPSTVQKAVAAYAGEQSL
jgi:transposase-like protein